MMMMMMMMIMMMSIILIMMMMMMMMMIMMMMMLMRRRHEMRIAPYANPATPVLCEPVQFKCTGTFHNSHFTQRLTGKIAKHVSRDARFLRAYEVDMHIEHFTKDISHGNLQEKGQTCMRTPRLNTGP